MASVIEVHGSTYVTTTIAAELLGCSPGAIRQWAWRYQVATLRRGRTTYYPLATLRARVVS